MALKTTAGDHGDVAKGRGAQINPEGRFERWSRDAAEDGWFQPSEEESPKPRTVVAIERAKSVISRHDSPDVGFAQSINPYRGCEHGCTYCMEATTAILMGDGRTLPISELKVGDEIYGTYFDGKWRRYLKSTVLAHWSVIKPAFRTTLEDGSQFVTSGDHRFLSDRGWKHVTGKEQGRDCRPHLTTNNKLMGTGAFAEGLSDSDDYRRGYLCGMLRGDATFGTYTYPLHRRGGNTVHRFRLALCDDEALLRTQEYLLDFGLPTHEFQYLEATGNHRGLNAIRASSRDKVAAIRAHEAWPTAPTRAWLGGYLAGIFDAEGCLSQTVFRISNTDAEIIGWICKALAAFDFRFVLEHRYPMDRKPIDDVRLLGGLKEQLRFFHTFRPAITRKLNLVGQALKSDAKLKVVMIEPTGKAMRLFDITTSTEDFIANGVVNHNCFARPSHGYLGLSPGMDFETRLSAKVNAAGVLREEISKPSYKCEPLTIGVNTDAYQPIEKKYRITREILEVCSELDHPVSLITKSALIERDIDLLAPMAAKGLVDVTISVTSLDNHYTRFMEPRTSAPARRLLAIERLSKASIPVHVNVAPVIPFLTDHELESILEAAANAGARSASYILVRLPWEVKDIFRATLEAHFPLKAAHVMSRIHVMRGGKDNDPNFGTRMTGQGLWADLLRQRFDKAVTRYGLDRPSPPLDTTKFRSPGRNGQASLF